LSQSKFGGFGGGAPDQQKFDSTDCLIVLDHFEMTSSKSEIAQVVQMQSEPQFQPTSEPQPKAEDKDEDQLQIWDPLYKEMGVKLRDWVQPSQDRVPMIRTEWSEELQIWDPLYKEMGVKLRDWLGDSLPQPFSGDE